MRPRFAEAMDRVCAFVGVALLFFVSDAGTARAQFQCPPGVDTRLCQDELDLQARSNVVQGSGARALGMAGAFLARADDATAASWNPAGLSYLRLPEISVVWSANSRFTSRERDSTGAQVSEDIRKSRSPDFLAVTYPFERGAVSGAAQLSFQRVIPFGGTRTINRSGQNQTIESSGGFDVIALGSGLQLTRRLRFGATLNYWLDGYEQTIDRETTRKGMVHHETNFDISGWNGHFGIIFSPWDPLNIGIVAKTALKTDVRLQRSRVDTTPGPTGDIVTNNSSESSAVVLEIPSAFGAGVSWRLHNTITLSLDYTYTEWSDGRIRNFFTLRKQLPGETSDPKPDVYPVLPYPTLIDLEQQDTEQIRVGVEYVAIVRRVKIPLRAGYLSDRQYFRAGDGSAPRFNGYAVGTGLIIGPIMLDAAYVHETGSYTNPDGTSNRIRVRSDRVFVSVIYRHGSAP